MFKRKGESKCVFPTQARGKTGREAGKCLSSDSVQSSSGVSSNGSLHLSIGSEFEPVSEV